jgi:ubiquinone/menaquinone biosynthesis C-methylase UbiE
MTDDPFIEGPTERPRGQLGNGVDDRLKRAVDRQRRLWQRQAPRYDRQMRFWERVLFGDAREWACRQAHGDVLEVAVGTGRNLAFYPPDTRLTGIDLSPAMLEIARTRARELGRTVELAEGDAHALAFRDASFDTVVCTFSLCNIPDERRAIGEMRRVLRPGGLLILADHVASTSPAWLAVQRVFEKLTFWLVGDHQTRRPLPIVAGAGLTIEHQDRSKKGIVERLTARKPTSPANPPTAPA